MTSQKVNQQPGAECGVRAPGTVMAVIVALVAWIGLLPLKAAAQATAPTYTVLYNFTGGTDGAIPDTDLTSDAAGNLYGTTYTGGSFNGGCYESLGCGVVFKLDPAGNETVLHAFGGGSDGNKPYSGVVQNAAGNLYGTTRYGGTFAGEMCRIYGGCGVVFKIDPAGKETVLHSFTGGSDGAFPYTGLLLLDAAGNLYGTTTNGGKCATSFGCGVVFKLDPAGNETVLHTFTGNDGVGPFGGLTRDAAGNLYGTAGGGSGSYGVIFKLDPNGEETVLYAFTGGLDGAYPQAGVVSDAAGNLYGTTEQGGDTSCSVAGSNGCGVVFELDPNGKETVLYAFTGELDGAYPLAGLIRDPSGSLYGTANLGGSICSECYGTLFAISPAGKEVLIHSFMGGTDGGNPKAGLLADSGYLYGTATSGGAYDQGVIFKISLR